MSLVKGTNRYSQRRERRCRAVRFSVIGPVHREWCASLTRTPIAPVTSEGGDDFGRGFPQVLGLGDLLTEYPSRQLVGFGGERARVRGERRGDRRL
jgi:hypothetical protein